MLLKEKNIPKYIIDDTEIFSDSDKENSDEDNSDKDNYNEENSDEKKYINNQFCVKDKSLKC